jgi:hypothetical protein
MLPAPIECVAAFYNGPNDYFSPHLLLDPRQPNWTYHLDSQRGPENKERGMDEQMKTDGDAKKTTIWVRAER